MHDFLKFENIPAPHCREHNVSGTTLASFLAKFKTHRINLARTDTITVDIWYYVYNIGGKFIIFFNYVCNWKIWRKTNEDFKQLYYGCGPFTNNKGMYTNLLKNYIIYGI